MEVTVPLEWDYTELAAHYARRGPYSQDALGKLFATLHLPAQSMCVDIGAGTGRLTEALVAEKLDVIAIEPNPEMFRLGQLAVPGARWLQVRGEATGLPARSFDLVTFGSSFNVLEPSAALDECARLLRPGGWVVCLWNHRDLDDPLQAHLQAVIESHVPGYTHGSRREDPTPLFTNDARYERVHAFVGSQLHRSSCAEFVAGFRAHATLIRQAGDTLPNVLDALKQALADRAGIEVPFITRIFAARRQGDT